MTEVQGASPNPPEPRHGLPEQWSSFELRMRKRRVARCLQRGAGAIDSGNIDEARAALDEARGLEPDSSELALLEHRLAALEAPPARPRRSRWRIAAAASTVLVVGAGASFGARYWHTMPSQAPATAAAATTATTAPPAPAPAPRDVAPARSGLRIVQETIRAQEIAPRIVLDEPRLPAYPSSPIAEPEPEPEPVTLAVNRSADPPAAAPEQRSTPSDPGIERRLDPVLPPPAPLEPLARASGAIATPPAVVPASRPIAPPVDPEALKSPDESSYVRKVLERYEMAYSSLDAAAASAVWPGVNRGALARAFEGLTSQNVSLGACDVTVNGPAARATCSGSATWEPKVGGGLRTESRRWNFDLRKNGDAWRIERAIAQ